MTITAHPMQLPIPPAGQFGWPWRDNGLPQARPPGDHGVWPRISIVTPSYNQGQFLEQTIRSVLQQAYPHLEYIVMDAASSDGSVNIIRKYSSWLTHWVSEKDCGQSDAINKGFQNATGTILGWLNSDDFLAPNALFKIAQVFLDSPALGAVVGIGQKIDERGRGYYAPIPDKVTRDSLFGWCDGNNFMQPACFFSRAAWLSAGPLRLDLDYCMDLALWFNIADRLEFKILNEVIAFINTHADAKTVKDRPKMFGEMALLMAAQPDGWRHGRPLLFKLLEKMSHPEPITRRLKNRMRTLLRGVG